jgi:hypothetical protein
LPIDPSRLFAAAGAARLQIPDVVEENIGKRRIILTA